MPVHRHLPKPPQWGAELPVSALANLLLGSDLPAQRANCYGQGELMFPPNLTRRARATRDALDMCLGCPIAEECLDMALGMSDWEDMCGVWAGTLPAERRELRATRRAA